MKPGIQEVLHRAIALSLIGAGTAAVAATPADSAGAVIDALKAAGYAEVRDVEEDDGLWEAEVRGEDGKFYDLHVVAATGEILDARSDRAVLTAEEIESRLTAAGYTDIHDLDLDDAIWEADARDADGQDVDLVINGYDGSVVSAETDD